MDFQRFTRYYKLRFTRLKGDPRYIAGGIAIGVIFGLTPMSPTPVAIALALVTKSSPVAAVLTSWALGNPLTTLPIYYISFLLGNWIIPNKLSWLDIQRSLDTIMHGDDWSQSLHVVMNMSWETMVVLFVGSLVFALPCAALAYVAAIKFFTRLRRKRADKHILR
ncbi:MAG: DUF2062 domain-containing protein [Desulfobulbaceae bacterium]|jgi:uncharacterized protein (DUF2062 family)|nr:DUF2062 domain-containing protein [Desulfobulbaceae bacterium]